MTVLMPIAWGQPQYLLRENFNTAAASPLTSPRACEPGPGSLTIVDTNHFISISGGQLLINGSSATDDKVVSSSSFARKAGCALLVSIPTRTTVGTLFRAGFDNANTGSGTDYGFDYSSTTAIRVKTGVSVIDTVTIGSGQHDFAVVQRGTGAFLLGRAGGSGAYTLLWVYNTATAAMFTKTPYFSGATTFNLVVDNVRVEYLGGGFLTDYGIATSREAISAANDTITMAADATVEHTITAVTGVNQELHVRRTDANNTWIIRMDKTNNLIILIEKNAGVETSRSSVAQTWTNGNVYRVIVNCVGSTIKTYTQLGSGVPTLKNSYSSATFNQTATIALVDRAGTDFIAWPNTLNLVPLAA